MRLDQLRNQAESQVPTGESTPMSCGEGQIQKQSFAQAIIGLDANAKKSPLYHPKVSIVGKRLSPEENSEDRVDLLATDGMYCITYTNNFCYESLRDPEKVKKCPFVLTGDVFNIAMVPIRYSGYRMLADMGSKILPLGIVVKYSNISPELFVLARRNPNVKFGFSFDFVRYYNDMGKDTSFYTDDLYAKHIEHERAKARGGNYINRIKKGLDPLTKEKM